MKNAYYKISVEEFANRFNRKPAAEKFASIDEAVNAHIKKVKDLKDGSNSDN